MYWSRTLIPTLRQAPAEAVAPSHQLMLRAGMMQQVASGSYSYLPLGWRVLQKVMAIVREEMHHAGAAELHMPTLQPLEWWEQTGRREAYGDNLFVLTDRHGRKQALGPTHEEVITMLFGSHVHSYRQLPLTLYQIQTKFRDEFRPRFGALRSREFIMKDAYSFHIDLEGEAGLDATYQQQYDAYRRMFERCGLPHVIVEAESGPIGGSASHEFMVPCETGEDLILHSDKGNYAANVEKCAIGPRAYDLHGEPTGDLEDLHTPGCPGIDDVITYCKKQLKTKIKPANMLKCILFQCITDASDTEAALTDERLILAVVRGDHDVNEAKLTEWARGRDAAIQRLQLADTEAAKRAGYPVGFVGPAIMAQRESLTMVIDQDAAQPGFWVTGGNEMDHHVKHFNWNRDVLEPLGEQAEQRVIVTELRNAEAGDPSPMNDGGTLEASRGIEVGHVFKLGAKYTRALNVTVTDEQQNRREVLMGCYGIGINRIVAASIENEAGHDDRGIIWPRPIAPYPVILTPIKYEGRMAEEAEKLHDQLCDALGEQVLLDDRDERPGVKFNDADLIGIPLRITLGDKSLAHDQVEVKWRTEAEAQFIALDAVVDYVRDAMA